MVAERSRASVFSRLWMRSAVRIPVSPLFSIFNSEEQGNSYDGSARVYDGSVIFSTMEAKGRSGSGELGETGRGTWQEDVKLAREIES